MGQDNKWVDVPFWFAWLCWFVVLGLPIYVPALLVVNLLHMGPLDGPNPNPVAVLLWLALLLDTSRIASTVTRWLHRQGESAY